MLAVVKRPRHAGNSAESVRRRVEDGGARFWRHRDFSDLPSAAVATALSRLAREGTLQRTAKGVYYHPVATRFGPSIAGASAAATYSLRAPAHPAGLSAANVLGLTTQKPLRPEFATPAAAPPSALSGAIVRTRRPAPRATLSAEDGAILETLRDRGRFSDLSDKQTAARLLRLLADQDRFERLARVSDEEPPRVRAMLGALGQELGASERTLARLRGSLNPLSRYDFGRLAGLRHARAWQAK
jgi:hypothetical protein